MFQLITRALKRIDFLVVALFYVSTYSQSISGKVVDSKYGTGIDSIKISVDGSLNYTYSDENGNFSFTPTSIHVNTQNEPFVFFNGRENTLEWNSPSPPSRFSLYNSLGNEVFSRSGKGIGIGIGIGKGRFIKIPETLENGFYVADVVFDSKRQQLRLFKFNNHVKQMNGFRNSHVKDKSKKSRAMSSSMTIPRVSLTFEKKGWVTQSQELDVSSDNQVSLERTKIKALIVDGFNNHNWQQTSVVLEAILGIPEFFDVTITTSPAEAPESAAYDNWNPRFKDYDVVLMNVCNISVSHVRWPLRIEKELEEFLAEGGGMFNVHAAVASFEHWDEYSKMIGLGWRAASFGSAMEIIDSQPVEITGGTGTTHAARIDAKVTEVNPHPITKGMPPIWMTRDTEVYQYARGIPENFPHIRVLSYANQGGKNWPFNLVIQYGQGYTFTTYMGHVWAGEKYPERAADIGFHTILIRASEWLARREIIYPIPDNFPTENQYSLDTTLSYLNQ